MKEKFFCKRRFVRTAGADALDARGFDFDEVIFGIAVQDVGHILVGVTVLTIPDEFIGMGNMFLHGFPGSAAIIEQIIDGYVKESGDFREKYDIRIGVAAFPLGDGGNGNVECVGDGSLGETVRFAQGNDSFGNIHKYLRYILWNCAVRTLRL